MTSTLSDEAAADKALAERKKMLAGLAFVSPLAFFAGGCHVSQRAD